METENPYSPPKVNLDTEPESLIYIGFWARTAAAIVDSLLMIAVLMPLMMAIYGDEAYNMMGFEGDSTTGGLIDLVVSYLLPAIAVLLFWFYKSATPGKMLVHAKIVDEYTGGKPSLGQFIVRYISYYLSSIVFMLGFIWIAFDRRKQGWHDKIAKTLVVRK